MKKAEQRTDSLMVSFLPVTLATCAVVVIAGSALADTLATITNVRKTVETAPAGSGGWQVAQVKAGLGIGDGIRTGPDAAAEFKYADGSVFRMAGSTSLTLEQRENHSLLKLLLGKLWFRQSKGTSLKVQTPSVVASITSHEEVFNVDESGKTRIVVLETDPGQPVIIQAIDANGNPIGSPITLGSGEAVTVTPGGLGVPVPTKVNVEQERSNSPGSTNFSEANNGDHDTAHDQLHNYGEDVHDRLDDHLNDIQELGGSPVTGNVQVEVK